MNDEWLEADLLDDAIENLEMLHFLLESNYNVRAKWKWIVIATYQALYEFAICSIRGTNDFPVIESNPAFRRHWAEFLRLQAEFDRLRKQTPTINDDKDVKQLRADLTSFLDDLHASSIEIVCDDLQHEVKLVDFAQLDNLFFNLDRRLTDAQLADNHTRNLIGIREALRRAQPANLFWRHENDYHNVWQKAYTVDDIPLGAITRDHDYWKIYTHSQPLITMPIQDKAIDRLIDTFRNGFVHRRPGLWAIEVDMMVECVTNVLPVIRFLALESNNVLFYRDDQRDRTENVLNLLGERFATMSRQTESAMNESDRQLAEQTVSYVAQHDNPADETDDEKMTKEKVTQILRDAGLLVEFSAHTSASPQITEEQREELARRFSVGKPLSEIIIEERER